MYAREINIDRMPSELEKHQAMMKGYADGKEGLFDCTFINDALRVEYRVGFKTGFSKQHDDDIDVNDIAHACGFKV